jgi:hypothetical protein
VTLALAAESIMDTAEASQPAPVAPASVATAGPIDRPIDDPIDELVERIRPWAVRAVDPLQIAAALESEGVTDRIAAGRYERANVFELAEDAYRRIALARLTGGPVPPGAGDATDRTPEPPWRRTMRDLSRGLLYLMPSAAFPAALALLHPASLVLVVLLAGAVGWVWSSVAGWFAYQYLGARRPASAARLLRWSTVAALPVAGLAGLAVAGTTDGGLGLVGLAVAMMAYQMASTLLIFYRGELWLGLVMMPAVTGGIAYLAAGTALAVWAVAGAGLSVAGATALALRHTVAAVRRAQRHRAEKPVRIAPAAVVRVTVYSCLAAIFLLHAQMPYMSTRLDIVVGVAPLLGGMGVVEWRARRYVERAPVLLARAYGADQFARGMLVRLVAETLVCMGAVAVLAAPLLAGLATMDMLTAPAIAMAGASTILGGAYFLGFVLAGQDRFGALAAVLATAMAAHLGAAALLPATPLADILAFLGSAVLLEVIQLVILAGTVGQAWRYRIDQGDECTP